MSHSQFHHAHLNLLHFVDYRISQAFQKTENLLPRQSFKTQKFKLNIHIHVIKENGRAKKNLHN